ncbi:transient receptor potential cation channel subfamily V member 6-like [Haliotis rufescens]|uniref:transient receptor potential cation channel subfamily V member 6-like n=1 Tax=Haliotis rufescens TaxID=6454 RepID=UPI00201EAD63|nr:transient receptor potential cation channel subfamily V member 6-like [Haliotis rufescens]
MAAIEMDTVAGLTGFTDAMKCVFNLHKQYKAKLAASTDSSWNNESVVREIATGLTPEHMLMFNSKNSKGNTVMHCIAVYTKKQPQSQKLLELFDVVILLSPFWWCQEKELQAPEDDKTLQRYKRDAVRFLTMSLKNGDQLSVLELAFQIGATTIVEKLMKMEQVTCSHKMYVKDVSYRWYDITHITPQTSIQTGTETKQCCLEGLVSHLPDTTNDILNLPPVQKIEQMYSSVAAKIYAVITLVHVLYMTAFSAICCLLMERRQTVDKEPIRTVLAFYSVGLIEPILITAYWLHRMYKNVDCRPRCCCMTCFHFSKPNTPVTLVYVLKAFAWPICYMTFVCLVLAFMITFLVQGSGGIHYLMSVTLLYGWLLTFAFAKGIRGVRFFLNVMFKEILLDVVKVILVYVVFLLGFALALHSQFLDAPNTVAKYRTPLQTMFLLFNVMLGITEMWDGNMEGQLEASGTAPVFSQLLYSGYILLVTILLLNLLIAMMVKSYTSANYEHPVSWKVESIQLGLMVENAAPWLSRLLGTGSIRSGRVFDDDTDPDLHVWYIQVGHEKSDYRTTGRRPERYAVTHVEDKSECLTCKRRGGGGNSEDYDKLRDNIEALAQIMNTSTSELENTVNSRISSTKKSVHKTRKLVVDDVQKLNQRFSDLAESVENALTRIADIQATLKKQAVHKKQAETKVAATPSVTNEGKTEPNTAANAWT